MTVVIGNLSRYGLFRIARGKFKKFCSRLNYSGLLRQLLRSSAFLSLKGRQGGGTRFRADLARARVAALRRLARLAMGKITIPR